MNLNQPLRLPIFNGGATSALSRIPTPFRAFPGGNIGYANRIEGVSSIGTDIGGVFTDIFEQVTDTVVDFGKSWLETNLNRAKRLAMEASGYQFFEVVEVNRNGVRTQGIRAKRPDGTFVVVFSDGSEAPWTSTTQATATKVDPKTGLSTGAVTGIAVGAVALVGLLIFLSSRKR